MILYHYWRSTSSWRVRWALELKGIKAELVHVSLLDGESESEMHKKRSPMGYVPVIEIHGKHLIESVAIIEWLEEAYSKPLLFPGDSFQRAHIRALVEIVNAGTQPLQNLSVLDHYSSDEKKRKEWCAHFIRLGLLAYNEKIKDTAGDFSVGNEVTAADLYLIPQVYNAYRFEADISDLPKLIEIYERSLKLPSCAASHPDNYKP
jgi:maleylacetoacetate isomerase